MTFEILIQIFLLGIGVSADAFSVALTDGLVYSDINKKKSLFIALTFGVMQAIMPLIGFWLIELVEVVAGEAIGSRAGNRISKIVVWFAFACLLFMGADMFIESFV